ncbi:hypothetical protein ACIA8R_02285 [Nonomuraea sp. NPDC051191]|uniref:hypothetical protein n=1 Tax=Nonomuraea sp. NPDC051191 TaxID=3364372 RepID=UPI0037B907C9
MLEWVRRVWNDATAQDIDDRLVRELGAEVYGLRWLFSEGGSAPETMQELRTLARTRLPAVSQCNVDAHSVRVLAKGLDHDVAYCLVDDIAVAASPERWAFAVHDGPLPERTRGSTSRRTTCVDLRRWSCEKRPPGDLTAGEVLGTVEIQFQQPSPDACRFTDFLVTRTRHGQAVVGMLARRVRQDLQGAGVGRTTGWLPGTHLYPHGRLFLRVLGRTCEGSDGPSVLIGG